MRVDEVNLLHEKAKNRRDGVYSYKGNLWAVKDNKLIGYVDTKGQVFKRFGAFNSHVGDLRDLERWEWKKKLVEWLKKQ